MEQQKTDWFTPLTLFFVTLLSCLPFTRSYTLGEAKRLLPHSGFRTKPVFLSVLGLLLINLDSETFFYYSEYEGYPG